MSSCHRGGITATHVGYGWGRRQSTGSPLLNMGVSDFSNTSQEMGFSTKGDGYYVLILRHEPSPSQLFLQKLTRRLSVLQAHQPLPDGHSKL